MIKNFHNKISVLEGLQYLAFYWNDASNIENIDETHLLYDMLMSPLQVRDEWNSLYVATGPQFDRTCWSIWMMCSFALNNVTLLSFSFIV